MEMGRKRVHRKDLPKRVYFNHGAYYFVALSGEWKPLGKIYVKAMTKYAQITQPDLENLGSVMDGYIRDEVPKLSKDWQIRVLAITGRLRTVFGRMHPDEVIPKDIYAFMDLCQPVQANRAKSVFSKIYKYAIKRGVARDNPCRLVMRNKEVPRDRDVDDADYNGLYDIAPPAMQVAMDLALVMGQREGKILAIQLPDLREDGIYTTTGKRKKKLLIEWTPELREIVERSKNLPIKNGKVRSFALICNRQGQAYTVDGFRALFQRHRNKALKLGLISESFTFHDIRAKTGGEATNSTDLLAHDDPKTTRRIYQRGRRKVVPLRPKLMRERDK